MPNQELDPSLNPIPSRPSDVFITDFNLGSYNLPMFRGIAPRALNHFIGNWIVSGQLEFPEYLAAMIEADNIKEADTGYFLDWAKKYYGIHSIYYPLCGWHTTPMYIFEEKNIVYLSNDNKHNYLEDIGTGLRLKADAITSSFLNSIFDAVFLKFSNRDFDKNQIPDLITELRRVVKPDGLFILDLEELGHLAKYWKKELQPADVPSEIKEKIKGRFGLFINRDRDKNKGFLQTLFSRKTGK